MALTTAYPTGDGSGGGGGGGVSTITIAVDVTATVSPIGDFAAWEIGDLPNTNMIIVGGRITLTGTKGQTNTVAASIGTAAMINSTNSGDKSDLIPPSANFDNGVTTVNLDYNSVAAPSSSLRPPKPYAAVASKKMYLNIQHPVNGATSDLVLTGTVVFMYLDIGGPEGV